VRQKVADSPLCDELCLFLLQADLMDKPTSQGESRVLDVDSVLQQLSHTHERLLEGSLESAHYSCQVDIWLQRQPYPRG